MRTTSKRRTPRRVTTVVRPSTVRRSVVGLAAICLLMSMVTLTVGAQSASAVGGSVSGVVFQDFNANGTRDPGSKSTATDSGMGGVGVTATDSAGAVVGTATTASDGAYTLTVAGAATTAVRLEFTPLAGYGDGPQGPDSGTTVQFVTIGDTAADLGLVRSGDYSPDNPYITLPVATSVIARNATPTSALAGRTALWGYPYSSSGQPTTALTSLALQGQIGTTWSEANYGTNVALSGAFFKRGAANVGSLGKIYATDVATAQGGAPNGASFVTIPNAGSDPRPSPQPDWFHDPEAFASVYKVGLGDLEISGDQSKLYAVNLNDRQLYEVGMTAPGTVGAAPTPGTPLAIALPLALPGAAQGCAQADVRPFGLGEYHGDLYVTLTCTAQTSGLASDLRGYVYKMNEATHAFSAAPAAEFALNYPRGQVFSFAGVPLPADFTPWSDTFHNVNNNAVSPQPMLSTVTFDAAGNMLVSIKDRNVDQNGNLLGSTNPVDNTQYSSFSGGETLRFCGSPTAGFTEESNGVCGGANGAGVGNGTGPGGGIFYESGFNFRTHDHTLLGSALQLAGYGTSMATAFDPLSPTDLAGPYGGGIYSEGFRTLSNANGAIAAAGMTDSERNADGTQNLSGNFGKAGGLGDLSALVGLAPVEIGNRVWLDSNHDGIQDAGEAPIAGVTVNLYAADGTTLIATAVTDADGDYYFTNSTTVIGTTSDVVVPTLAADTAYVVKVDKAADYASGGALAGLAPTLTAGGGDTSADSNGVATGGVSVATVTTGDPGVNDHTIDFGFFPSYSLGNRLWFDTGAGAATNNGIVDVGEQPVVGAQVELLTAAGGPVDPDGPGPLTQTVVTTDANGYYRFDDLAVGDYKVRVSASNFAAGGVLQDYLSSTGADGAFAAGDNNTDHGVDSATPATNGITSATVSLTVANPTGEADAGATGSGGHGSTPDVRDNLTVDFGFVLPYDLMITKALTSTGPYAVGSPVGYTLTVTNNGPGTALTGFTVTDQLPAGLSFGGTAAAGTNWACAAPAGQSITCTYTGADLASGATAPAITVSADIVAGAARSVPLTNNSMVVPSPNQHNPETIPVGTANGGFENGSNVPTPANPSNNDDSKSITVSPSYAVGDHVWFDANHNGIQDAGESGVPGVTATLQDGAGLPVTDIFGTTVSSVVTDAAGHYVFDSLPAGTYQVVFSNLPAGYQTTLQNNAGTSTDGTDSNTPAAATVTATTSTFTIGAGLPGMSVPVASDGVNADEINRTIDAGIAVPVAVGDYVFSDSNRNGKQDAGELPVPGVTVTLQNPDGTAVTDFSGNPVTSTTTDANGHYAFDNLVPGDYQAVFSSLPTGYIFTTRSAAGTTTANDSNPDIAGVTPVFTVVPGAADMRAVQVGDGTTTARLINPTIDAGIVLSPAYAVGDYVWFDSNSNGVQDAGEKPVVGATATLLNTDGSPAKDLLGNPVPPVLTNAAGHYVFDNLSAGIYQVQFSTLPTGYVPTSQQAGSDTTVDSNPNATALTPPFTLGPVGSGNMTAPVAGDGTTFAVAIDRTIDMGIVLAKVDPAASTVLGLTGVEVGGTLTIALGALGAGGALLLVRRRRSSRG